MNMNAKTSRNASPKQSHKEGRLSRREVLKGAGALVVSFNLFGPVSHALAQLSSGPDLAGDLQATSLDSWIALGRDGVVSVFSSKVDLGTAVETALAQTGPEELAVQSTTPNMTPARSTKHRAQAPP